MFKKYYEVKDCPVTIGMYTKLCVVCTAIYAACMGVYFVVTFADEIGGFFYRQALKIKYFFEHFKRSKSKG